MPNDLNLSIHRCRSARLAIRKPLSSEYNTYKLAPQHCCHPGVEFSDVIAPYSQQTRQTRRKSIRTSPTSLVSTAHCIIMLMAVIYCDTQSSSDNLPAYLPYIRHGSDDVRRRQGGAGRNITLPEAMKIGL